MAPLADASKEELIERALAAHEQMQATQTRLEGVEAQLRWFKQQLFGARSGRRSDQGDARIPFDVHLVGDHRPGMSLL